MFMDLLLIVLVVAFNFYHIDSSKTFKSSQGYSMKIPAEWSIATENSVGQVNKDFAAKSKLIEGCK